MKELSKGVNVNAYVHVNFEEMVESFRFISALRAKLDRPGVSRLFLTHTPTHTHIHRVAEQTTSPAHKQV